VVFTPISVFISFVALSSINPELEEMGLLYTDTKGVVKNILLPNIYPYLFLSLFIVSILSFGESSIDNTLSFKSFSLEIFTLFSAMYDYDLASVLVIFLLFVLFIMLSIYRYFFSEKLHFDKFYQMEKVYTLSPKNQILSIFLTLGFILLFIVTPFFGIFSNINIQSLSDAIISLKDAILHTLFLSTEVALLFCFNSFIFATTLNDDRYFQRWLKQIIFYIFLLPSTIYAISLIGLFNHSYFDPIYSSLFLLVVAISLKYLAVGVTLSKLNLYKITPSQLDSAKLLGANFFYILRYIIIPSSKRIFWVLFLIGFIFSYREVDLGYLLNPIGYETISMHLLTTMANSKSSIISSNIFITIFLPLIPLFFLTKGLR
jgi:iron(III) transport system permease protein